MHLRKRVVSTVFVVCSFCLLSVAGAQAETSLRDTVLDTLKQHPALRSLQYAEGAAQQDHRQARGGYFPRLDASARYGAESYNSPETRREDREWDFRDRMDAGLTARQLIWDGHRTTSMVGAAEAAMRSASSQYMDAADTIGLDAIIAHVGVYRQIRLVTLAQDNVTEHQDMLASLEERERLGAGSIADVTQTRGRLARALTTLSNAQSDLNVAMANYLRLTGISAQQLAAVSGPVGVPASVEEAAATTLENNPKVATLTAEMDRAEQLVAQNEANYYPEFAAEAYSGFRQNADGNTSYIKQNQLMLTVDWNLYKGGSDVAGVRAAKARKLAAEMNLRDVRESLMENVSASWSQYEAAREQVGLYTEAAKYNLETRDMYLQQFSVGQRTLLDVLDAENELFTSRGQLVTAEMNVIVGAYRLLALNGGLLESFDITKTEFTPLESK